MNFLKKTIAFASVLAATTFYNCSDNRPTINFTSSQNISSVYEKKLQNANEILIEEKVLSFGKEYGVYVNDEKVATLEGKDINWWEDRFILKTLDGKILETENENKRILNFDRSSAFYDGNGNINGYISEHTWQDLFNWNHIFHIYDANQNEIGKTENKFLTFLTKIELYDMQGNMDYLIKEKFNVFNDTYLINVLDKNSIIPVEKAIILTCIEDAISDAKAAAASSSVNEAENSNDDATKDN